MFCHLLRLHIMKFRLHIGQRRRFCVCSLRACREPESTVISRSGDECVVAELDQWFLKVRSCPYQHKHCPAPFAILRNVT